MERENLIALVTAAQTGDQEAMNTLFNHFYNDVYYFALKTVKDSELACDITQETFVAVITNLNTLQEPAAFVSWMKKITYSQCTRYFRKKKEVLVDEDEEGGTVFDIVAEDRSEFIPDEAMEQEDFRATILAMIDTLSEEQRAAVMLYYYDELPVEQVAQIQGVSTGTVKSRLNYARKAIRRSVEEYEKKNGLKLHSFGILPLIIWLLGSSGKKAMPIGAAKIAASGITAATGVTVSISTTVTGGVVAGVGAGIAGGAAVAGASGGTAAVGTAAAVGFFGKLAALPLATKIGGGLAALLLVGGTGTAVVVHNLPPDPPAVVQTMAQPEQTTTEAADVTELTMPTEEITLPGEATEPQSTDPTETTPSATQPQVTEPTEPSTLPQETEPTEPQQTEPTQPEETTPPVTELMLTTPTEPAVSQPTEPEQTTPPVIQPPQNTEPAVTEPQPTEPEETTSPTTPPTTEPTEPIETTPPATEPPETTEPEPDWETVPSGCQYEAADGSTYASGQPIRQTVQTGDKLVAADYTYTYESGGWNVRVNDKKKTSYGTILSTINGASVTSMQKTFRECTAMKTAPAIPSSVTTIREAFYLCESLQQAPSIPSGVKDMQKAFWSCYELKSAPSVPGSVRQMDGAFYDCLQISSAPSIPTGVKSLRQTFDGCVGLTKAPAIPDTVQDLYRTFNRCSALTQVSAIPSGVTNMEQTFSGCRKLTSVPTLPAAVQNLSRTFKGCTQLTGTIVINAQCGSDSISGCFAGTTQAISITGSCPWLQELAATAENTNVTVS